MIPIVGLLLILTGIVYAIVLSFSIVDDDDGDDGRGTEKQNHSLSRLLVLVGHNISQVLRNGTGNATEGGH